MHRPCLALFLLYAMSWTAPALATTIDRVVVVVEEEIILASDVRVEAMLSGLDSSPLPFFRVDHATAEERLVMAALVRALAGEVSLYDPPPDAVQARVDALQSRLGPSWEAWLALTGLDDEGVQSRIRRRMRVEAYLSRNLPEDPADVETWRAACRELLDSVRDRFSVRRVERRAP